MSNKYNAKAPECFSKKPKTMSKNNPIDQDAFDIVVKHLKKQGCKSQDKTGTGICMYRGPSGTKCAIGILINDKVWHENLEFRPIKDKGMQRALRDSGWGNVNQRLLKEVQYVHDRYSAENWYSHLLDVAYRFKLTMPEVE